MENYFLYYLSATLIFLLKPPENYNTNYTDYEIYAYFNFLTQNAFLNSINEDHNQENEQRQVFRRSFKVRTKLKAIMSWQAHE